MDTLFNGIAGLGDFQSPAGGRLWLLGQARFAEATYLCVAVLCFAAIILWRAFRSRPGNADAATGSARGFVSIDALVPGRRAVLESHSPAGMSTVEATLGEVTGRAVVFFEGEFAPILPIGSPVRVTVACGAAAYIFQSCVRDRLETTIPAALYLDRPEWVEKLQRREYYRVPVRLAATVHTVSPGDGATLSVRGDIDSLSAGGFRVALHHAVTPGSTLRVRLPIDSLVGSSFEARVVDCVRVHAAVPLPFSARCEFVCMGDDLRNLLVSHCFDVEREVLRGRAA